MSGLALAQMPDTDIWLFKLKTDKLKKSTLVEPHNLTNRPGYDNQPSFSADGKRIFYVSVREDNQADIYVYDISSKKNVAITKSKVSEYSPVLSSDGKYLNSVVVEEDSAQRIHWIDVKTGFHTKKLEMDSVGYYTFLNSDTVIYYKLTEPHSLRYFSSITNEDKWLGNSPVRAFKAINRHTLIYGIKDSSSVTYYKYNFLLHKAERYCDYASLSEDAIWHPQMGLIKSEGTRLLRFNESTNNWELLYDLAVFGIKKITRFAFDAANKQLVVVNNL